MEQKPTLVKLTQRCVIENTIVNATGNHTIVMSISGEGKWDLNKIHIFFDKQSQKNTELSSRIRRVLKCYGG